MALHIELNRHNTLAATYWYTNVENSTCCMPKQCFSQSNIINQHHISRLKFNWTKTISNHMDTQIKWNLLWRTPFLFDQIIRNSMESHTNGNKVHFHSAHSAIQFNILQNDKNFHNIHGFYRLRPGPPLLYSDNW